MPDKVKIMVVDDTITYRQILTKVVQSFDNAELVATASSGKTALMKIASVKPDLIFLDVMMPEMDGIETLKFIKRDHPKIQVVMISAFDMANAKATLQSLENGALDFIAKPVAQNMTEGITQLQTNLKPLIELVANQLGLKGQGAAAKAPPTAPPRAAAAPIAKSDINNIKGKVDFALIGISTGGPNALHKLFDSIKTPIDCPVLIVQHMPPMFTQSLAERLDSISCMTIKEASDGMIPEKGHVYIAPGGMHMVLRKKGASHELGVVDSPPVNHCKPSVDVLFRSVAGLRDTNSLTLVLTGMGRDGTEGVRALKRQGTYCIIQDEASCVVWGMPGSVHEAQAYDEMLPLPQIGKRILEITQKG